MPESAKTSEPQGPPKPEKNEKTSEPQGPPKPEENGTVLVEKQNPGAAFLWKPRLISVDETRGALVYQSEDKKGRRTFKGAIPLSLVTSVEAASPRKLVVAIPGRSFVLRLPKAAKTDAELKALTNRLLDALAAGAETDGVGDHATYPPNHWKEQARYTSLPLRADGAAHAAHPGYPERAKLLSGTYSWEVALPTYAPPTFTAAGVTTQAAPDGYVGWTGPMRMEGGVAVNPSGRTGLAGQGELPRCGPNQELRTIVTRRDAGCLYVAVVRKAAGGEFTLPGGFIPLSASGAAPPSVKMLRHAFALQAAAGSSRNGPVLDSIFKEGDAAPPSDAAATADAAAPADAAAARPAWLLHLGYCNHSVNTDHAWLESAVCHFHCTEQEGSDLLLGEGAGMRDARWIKVPLGAAAGGNPGFWSDLRPAHRRWVRTALLRHGAFGADAAQPSK